MRSRMENNPEVKRLAGTFQCCPMSRIPDPPPHAGCSQSKTTCS